MSPSRVRLLAVPAVLACALVVAGAPSAPAQCFGPDNLDIGNCCQPVFPNLPQFDDVFVPGMGVCWTNCAVSATQDLRVDWPAPNQTFCGEYVTTLTVSDPFIGVPVMTGTMVLDYTRTWIEIDTAGNQHQVWRFTAKADLSAPAGLPPICPVPTCITPVGPHPTAFFYGYVDYSTCNPGDPWQNALVLYHACDRFIHSPGLSDRPGTFHPGSSYAIVAPHSAAQPFFPTNLIASGGPVVAEATRNVDTSSPPPASLCVVEDPVVAGDMGVLGAGCVCTLTTFPKHQTLRKFTGTTACVDPAGIPGGWTSLDIAFPTLPWKHMVTSSIGRWTSPVVYPGTEEAWVDEGLFVHQDPCSGNYVELKYGGTTRNGWTPLLPIPVVVSNFTDLADNYTAPLFGPHPTPILGSIRQTDHLIYVNEP